MGVTTEVVCLCPTAKGAQNTNLSSDTLCLMDHGLGQGPGHGISELRVGYRNWCGTAKE